LKEFYPLETSWTFIKTKQLYTVNHRLNFLVSVITKMTFTQVED